MPKIRISDSQPSSENASLQDGDSSTPPAILSQTRRELGGNWLRGYLEYTKESESPQSFHLWTGLSVLASAVRRNVFLDQQIYTLYPHLFVILTGPPGKVAKSTSIRLGRTLLYSVQQIKFGPDSVTVEELVRQLENAGRDSVSCAMTIHSTELSSLIQPSEIKMVQFLTDIYDGDVNWQYATKGSGTNSIKNPVLNLLAGTTPSYLADGFPASAIGHGFTSRVIFVYEDKPRFLKPFPGEANRELVKLLVNDLNHIALLRGEFTWAEGAKDVYEEYYKQIYATQPADYRVEGYHWRKKNHLLKVAMLLSISEDDSLLIRPVDLETAWDILAATEKKMNRAFSAVGKYEHASDLERILYEIQEAGSDGMTEQEINDRNYAVAAQDDLKKILKMLTAMGRIKLVKGEDEVYVYKSRANL